MLCESETRLQNERRLDYQTDSVLRDYVALASRTRPFLRVVVVLF